MSTFFLSYPPDATDTPDVPDVPDDFLEYFGFIEEVIIGKDKVMKLTGHFRNEACSIYVVLRGYGSHILYEKFLLFILV